MMFHVKEWEHQIAIQNQINARISVKCMGHLISKIEIITIHDLCYLH